MEQTQIGIKVACRLDCGKEKIFYFLADASGFATANYCEDFNASEACAKCGDIAKKKLLEKYG